MIPLGPNQATLKLTSSSYWRPSGVNIHRLADASDDDPWGVSPDIAVDWTDDQRAAWAAWRRSRDLIAIDGAAAAESPNPQDADPFVAAAVAAARR